MKFSIKDFFSKCNQIRRKLLLKFDLVTFTEEILLWKTSNFVHCKASIYNLKNWFSVNSHNFHWNIVFLKNF